MSRLKTENILTFLHARVLGLVGSVLPTHAQLDALEDWEAAQHHWLENLFMRCHLGILQDLERQISNGFFQTIRERHWRCLGIFEPCSRLKLVTKDGVQYGVDFMGNSLFKGPEVDPSSLTLDLGMNTSLKIKRDWGKVNLRTGGVTWYRQSRLTVWGNQSFNRMSLFDRRPQTAVNRRPWMRYQQYLDRGLVDMGLRYGSRAFQGAFLGLSDLPFGMQLKGVVGKSNFNRAYFEGGSNFTSSWRLAKSVKSRGSVAYNLLVSQGALDSLGQDVRSYQLHTLESKASLQEHVVVLEGGWGRYSESVTTGVQHGAAFFLDIRSTPKATLPLSFRAYRISPEFVNVTGNFLNSSVLEVFPNVAGIGATVRAPFESPMVGLGTPVNNRQGIELHADGRVLNCQVNVDSVRRQKSIPHQEGFLISTSSMERPCRD